MSMNDKKMIIRCTNCGTRFWFNEALVQGEGVWVRCSRCENVFFQENPSAPPPAEPVEDEVADRDVGQVTEGVPGGDVMSESENEAGPTASGKGILKKTAVAVFLLLLVLGVVVWLMPEVLTAALPGGSYIARYFGIGSPGHPAGPGIDLVDVRDRYVKNWLAGDMMVIGGTAVNRNAYPVSKLRVKGTLLDAEGRVVAEAHSYCGNTPTDEDLTKLTVKEILDKLSLEAGSDAPNMNIAPGGRTPFITVFVDPPKTAVEYIVEVVSVEASKKK